MDWLWLVPALPLAGFLVLFVTEGRLPERPATWVGAGSVGLSALAAAVAGSDFLQQGGVPQTQICGPGSAPAASTWPFASTWTACPW